MAGYGTDPSAQDWLDANGFVLPDGSPTLAQMRQRGSVSVDGRSYPGVPTGGFAQERAWPRVGATAYGAEIPSNVIPVAIEQAAYAAGYFDIISSGGLTTVSSADGQIKRKKERVEGVVEEETEYFAAAGAGEAVTVPMVEDLLAPFVLGEEPAVAFGLLALG